MRKETVVTEEKLVVNLRDNKRLEFLFSSIESQLAALPESSQEYVKMGMN